MTDGNVFCHKCLVFTQSYFATSQSPWIGLIGHCLTFFKQGTSQRFLLFDLFFFSALLLFLLSCQAPCPPSRQHPPPSHSSIRVLDRLIKLRGATGFSLVCRDCSGLIIIYYQRSLATESKVIRHAVPADSSHSAPSVTGLHAWTVGLERDGRFKWPVEYC